MKALIFLAVSLVVIIALSGTVAIAADSDAMAIINLPVCEGGVKKFFAELNSGGNKTNPLFEGWSEQEVISFYETARLLVADGDATTNLIKRHGIKAEANSIIRELVARGGEPHQYFAVAIVAYYLVAHKLPPKARILYLWGIAVIEITALQTHEPFRTIPSYGSSGPWMVTVIHHRF